MFKSILLTFPLSCFLFIFYIKISRAIYCVFVFSIWECLTFEIWIIFLPSTQFIPLTINFHLIFQLSADLNPSCPSDVCSIDEEDSKITLVHIKADGDNDTLHYIWDLSRQPSVLVALCERNTNVTFEWNSTFKDVSRINFTTKPKYTMSFVLTKVSSIRFVHYYRVFFQSLGPLSNWTFIWHHVLLIMRIFLKRFSFLTMTKIKHG